MLGQPPGMHIFEEVFMLPRTSATRENPPLPFFETCRALKLDATASLCNSGDKKFFCEYFVPFYEGHLCTHPLHRSFLTPQLDESLKLDESPVRAAYLQTQPP